MQEHLSNVELRHIAVDPFLIFLLKLLEYIYMETKVLNYRIIIEPEKYPDGSLVYNAYCPTLGVADYGDTIEEVLESIREGVTLYVKTLVEDGEEVPADKLGEELITSTQVSAPRGAKIAIA